MKDPHLFDNRFAENRKYDIKQLWELHHEILRRIALGQSNTEIAEDLGITPQTVSNTRNSPMGRAKLSEFEQEMDAETIDLNNRIMRFCPKAMDLLEDVVEGRDHEATIALRVKTAENCVARAGYGPVHKAAIAHGGLSLQDIERIKRNARNAAVHFGVIDAKFIELESN